MSRADFWGSTPREIYDEFAAARRREEDVSNRDTILAWRIVHIWARTRSKGRMPALRPMLRLPPTPARQRSHDAQLAVLHVLSAQYGIPLQRRTLTK